MLRVVMSILFRPWIIRAINRRLDELEARLIDVHANLHARDRSRR